MFERINKVVMGIILLKELCVWTVCVCVCESCECETQLPKNGMSVCADQCTALSRYGQNFDIEKSENKTKG